MFIFITTTVCKIHSWCTKVPWLLKASLRLGSSFERSVCEKTRQLTGAPQDSFIGQIHVTLAVTLMIDWAAATNLIASQVLHMLLTGSVGDKDSWTNVRSRLSRIKKILSGYSSKRESFYSSVGLNQRLGSPFWLPPATPYPDIKAHAQQAKADAASLGANYISLFFC